MRPTKLALLSTGLCFALFACRGGGDDGDDTPMPDAPVGGVVKISEIQNDMMAVGTPVSVVGVVVTAVDEYGNRTGDFFVQDPAGGPFSGIKVFGAPLAQVADLEVGDIVDITNAEKDEFALTSDMSGRKVTELKGAAGGMMTVTRHGPGTAPAPAVVDAKMLATLPKAEREAEWEKWEGVLVKVTNPRQLADTDTFGSMPGPDSNEFRITGIARVQSALTELNADGAFGVCYESITGVVDYFFNDIVAPRSTADIVSGGTACNPFATTIVEAQTGTNVEIAELTDVFVMGLNFSKKSYWVSTSLTAAPGEGIFVFASGDSAPVLDVGVIGKKVTVRGAVDEFNDDAMGGALTEVVNPSPLVISADPAGAPVAVVGKTAAELMMPANGAAYESVLVTLTNVAVDSIGNAANGFIATGHQGATAVKMSTEIVRLTAAQQGCYTTITGFWTNLQAGAAGATTKPNSFGFAPMTLGTTQAAALCN